MADPRTYKPISQAEWDALPLPDLSDYISEVLERDRCLGAIILGLQVKKLRLPGSYGLATDGVRLIIDPELFENLLDTPAQRIAGLCHEAMHVGALHPLRGKAAGVNITKWNFGGDFAANEILFKENFDLPKEGLLDTHKCWTQLGRPDPLPPEHRLLSMEEYIAELPENMGEDMVVSGCLMEAEAGEAQEIITRVQAAINSTSGNIAGALKQEMEVVLAPPPKWLGQLRQFMRGHTRGMSWKSFNRKTINDGVYLPGRRTPGHKTLMLWVDTSGSVPDQDIKMHLADIAGIVNEEPPELLVLGQFDHDIQSIVEVKRGEMWPKVDVSGRGGTNFIPPLEHKIEADAIVMLTDGEGPFPQVPPKVPVLWVLTTGVEVPFGLTARVKG